ncbi:MAG: hypothetical protein EKK40_13155 [Bradyrhizobiaceae bacterium]|nr:MAG: hypothetical protein EKK40_13155 [Bradyrhizobiaceae bacterium]
MSSRSPNGDYSQPQCRASDGSAGDGGPAEAAAFIATMLSDLKQISRRHRLETLNYLLELAHLEAQDSLSRRKAGDV